MQTEAVIVGTDGVARLAAIELPALAPTCVLIETLVGGVSCGTEGDCVSGRARYLQRPVLLGYQAVGKVVRAGEQVRDFQPGDLVLTRGGGLWDIACIGGSHARHSVSEAADLIKLNPAVLSLETVSYSVLAAVAYEALSRMKIEK
ncbi:MAG TPA: alcohol dehydrogenase catalytic domain-containing protein, partial [Candidatus Methylacidiphilales bacterium]|nr:alcohol dehydrogenase catalytic domain-containing protein [Candidatus Methylacidiphilales bacterium]